MDTVFVVLATLFLSLALQSESKKFGYLFFALYVLVIVLMGTVERV